MSKPPFSITAALARISQPDGPLDADANAGGDGNAVVDQSQTALTTRQPRNPKATRRLILDAAFYEIRMAGFAGASINQILERTGTTKGALYHHFPGKAKLVHAVIEECLPQYINDVWLGPLDGVDDVLPVLMGQVDCLSGANAPELLDGGCPLARLASGAAELDESLRKRIDGVYRYWRRGLASHLGRGQFNKTIRTDIESSSVAEFIIATLHGFLTRPPSMRNSETHEAFAREYARYLNGLRP
ncbi:TetR/AcrR family transcriptional regulator [Thalassospira alkalitolerans]|uniref:TetR family transcriptional regulator n=1 Tax=Thalassospira alkalitolerans TaxID=1293890 RepID=A0A1Y2LCW6_9PROT|nr:TetR/AcrR family transcriptional regulator [Thalassospira alkalitolerans]OSQ47398.1 TetR family transcriptional regulator [Thalassospira alkalitolerans]